MTGSVGMLRYSGQAHHVVVQDGPPVKVEPFNLSAALSRCCVSHERPAYPGQEIRLLRRKPADGSRGQAAPGPDIPEGYVITCTDICEGVRPFDGRAFRDLRADD